MTIIKNIVPRVLFPPKCPVCGKITEDYEDKVCSTCIRRLPIVSGSRCMRCSKQTDDNEMLCADCRIRKFTYVQGYALWHYDISSKNIMKGLKYYGRRDYVDFIAAELVYHARFRIKEWQPDGIVPVPLHLSKYKKRGFNQAEVIAREVSVLCGVRLINDVLFRTKKTRPQKYLDDKDRESNLKDAFSVNTYNLKQYHNIKRVIIIDDIYTTGSTIDACARKLKEAGITSYFLTVCIGDGF